MAGMVVAMLPAITTWMAAAAVVTNSRDAMVEYRDIPTSSDAAEGANIWDTNSWRCRWRYQRWRQLCLWVTTRATTAADAVGHVAAVYVAWWNAVSGVAAMSAPTAGDAAMDGPSSETP